MISLRLTVLLAILIILVMGEQARFDNYRVFEVKIENANQLKVMQHLEEYPDGYMFWESPVQTNMKLDIMVPPHKVADFEELGSRLRMPIKLKISNVQELVDNERPSRLQRAGFGWDDYHTLDEMYDWIDGLVSTYPDILSVEVVGTSYEDREMRAVKLSHKAGNPGIFLESNIHAREWITSATATWILNELLTSADPEVQNIAQNYDWFILPVVNPDGFNYTKETNRMWRKTRFPHNLLCYGADMNRNFPHQWMHGGASMNACTETYAGPEPASEIETRNIMEYFTKYEDQIDFYLSFHSYGQLILFPYGYENAEKAENFYDWMEMGEAAAIALSKRYGTLYKFGNTADTLYVASGSSRDWALGAHNVPIAASYEFRDQGHYGFILPADQIVQNSEEVLDSLLAFLRKAREAGYFQVK